MRNIETGKYWDFGWKLCEGCTPVSEGCLNCWSLGMEKRFGGGEVRFMADRVDRPLKRKKPAIYSVWNDLFHEDLETNNVRATIDTARQCQQHTFLALTKRAWYMQKTMRYLAGTGCPCPENLWLGVTVENGNHLDRLEDLRHCPGWHFASIEPILGRVEFPNNPADYLNWVIVGCETGPGARIDENTNKNIDSIVDQCLDARLPFWVKARAEYKNGKWTYTHDVPKELRQYPEELKQESHWMKGGLK
ncbi:MAG TPA: DUF5131 family protein [Anaerohalosphaeraceae bacterium]|nr:DUF5131 family protein [Anaerohalosphaeraceae bacterium]HOL32594.1 DUF5131 family protein [Anaerohalosphaeraceae bacterium]